MNKITILGSGTSTGVPILGCKCKVCQSNDRRNTRFRTSALIETSRGENILIDASPDLRSQLLQNKIQKVDAVVITHDHADHTHGIDDLRPFSFHHHNSIPVYADKTTCSSLRKKFPYIFERKIFFGEKPILGGGIPLLDLSVVEPGQQMVLSEKFELHTLPHGHTESLCFRHEKLAYIVDCRQIPEATLKSFQSANLDILIIDCLRPEPHQTHLHFDLTIEYVEFIRPKLAIFTHMGHEWDYLDLTRQIKKRGLKNAIPAMDGQCFPYSNL